MRRKIIGLILVGVLSISMVGCKNNEYQELQIQQEQTIDALSVIKDLEFYDDICSRMLNATSKMETIEGYNIGTEILNELREYNNCVETDELKNILLNAVVCFNETVVCILKGDLYNAQKLTNDFVMYTNEYQREINILVEEYYN
jgi:hypothetical protein